MPAKDSSDIASLSVSFAACCTATFTPHLGSSRSFHLNPDYNSHLLHVGTYDGKDRSVRVYQSLNSLELYAVPLPSHTRPGP
jgi:hypothetical protein